MFGHRTVVIFLWLITLSCTTSPPSESLPTERQAPTQAAEPMNEESKLILFLGDSLTAGYGLDPAQAFPAIIQDKIRERSWDFRVVNAGISGDTTSSGLSRVDWYLDRKVDVLFLELGANDGLRGISLALTRENLQKIIDRVRQENPEVRVIIAGMMIPTNLGPDYTTEFKDIFIELASANDAVLIPFLLEGVAAQPQLNLEDGIHPTAEGHRIVSENVWRYMEPVLAEMVQQN